MSEPTIYHLSHQEIHMFGDYVAVVWNTSDEEQRMGEKRIITAVRDGDPYILFVSISTGDDGEPWRDEDSPVEGGLSLIEAEQVAQELARAIAYLRTL